MNGASPATAEPQLSQSDLRLATRYRRMFLAVVLPLLALVVVLAVTQYRAKRAQVLHELTQQTAFHVGTIEPAFKSAIDHVRRIRHRFENYLPAPPVYLKDRPEYFTPRVIDGRLDGYTFDALPDELKSELGQFVWFDATNPNEATAGQAVVDQALDFFSLAKFAHAESPELYWSYFFSAEGNFFNVFPWIPSRQATGDRPNYARNSTDPPWISAPAYAPGVPARNPEGREYWVGPYLDTAGAGYVVTLAAPVYIDGAFKGVAATDIRLQTFHQRLRDLRPQMGRILVLDSEGTLLADSARDSGDVLQNIRDTLPSRVDIRDIEDALRSPARPRFAGSHTLIARGMPQTRWSYLYLVSDQEINAWLLPHFIPYLVIIVAVAAAFLLALLLLRRQFIEPAFRLVRYIQSESHEGQAALPEVPLLWRPWVDAVAVAFQSNRESNRRLRDSLSEQKRSEEQLARQREALRQSEKLSAMGALLAGVAHELNNPLAILMARAALLESRVKEPGVKDVARKIYDAAERCGRIVRMFLSMARQRPQERRPAQLNNVAVAALELLGYSLRSAGIRISTSFDPDLPVIEMDADQVGQIVVNLIVNAQHALAEQGGATPGSHEIRLQTRKRAGMIELCVSDDGPGVAAELRERIFDPFFTTKPAGSGTGVGLAVSLAIARAHRGDLRLEPTDVGAAFVLSLPVGSAEKHLSSRRQPEAGDDLFAGHVLIVDDEIEMTEVLGEILESAGFTTTRLTSGRSAIEWLRNNDCDIILTDMRMPDLDGPALWRALKEQRPELVRRIAFVTGDTLSATVEPFLRSTGLPWLEKPFTPEQVLELVARVEAAAPG